MQIHYRQNKMAVVPGEAQALAPQGSPLEHSYRMHPVPLDLNSVCEGLHTRQAPFTQHQCLSRADHLGTVSVTFPTDVTQ